MHFERGGDFNLQDWNLRVSSETICGIRCGFQPEAYCTRVAIIPPSGPPGRVIGRDPCPEDIGGVEGWWWVKRHERLDEHKGAGWVLGSQQPCWSRGLGRGRSASVTGCRRTGMRLATALLEPATPIHRQEGGPLRRPFCESAACPVFWARAGPDSCEVGQRVVDRLAVGPRGGLGAPRAPYFSCEWSVNHS